MFAVSSSMRHIVNTSFELYCYNDDRKTLVYDNGSYTGYCLLMVFVILGSKDRHF